MSKDKRPQQGIQKTTEKPVQDQSAQKPIKNNKPSDQDDITKKRWYIYLTIFIGLIAAFGGYPGIKDMFQSPDFEFEPERIMIGIMHTAGSPTSILVSGVAINNGSKPLLVKRFELQVVYNGQTYKTIAHGLDSNYKFIGSNFRLESGDLSKIDLQKVNKLSPDDPIAGAILFSTTIPHDALAYSEHYFVLTCIDYRNKKYSYKIEPPEKSDDNMFPVFPKTNSKLVPLDSTADSQEK